MLIAIHSFLMPYERILFYCLPTAQNICCALRTYSSTGTATLRIAPLTVLRLE